MSIAGSPSLKSGEQIRVLFTLPGQRDRFTVESEVRWYDEKGHAGLRSLLISSEQQHVLQEWLAAKLEEDLPESVASQFPRDRQRSQVNSLGGCDYGEHRGVYDVTAPMTEKKHASAQQAHRVQIEPLRQPASQSRSSPNSAIANERRNRTKSSTLTSGRSLLALLLTT
jgi:hypothetical protein